MKNTILGLGALSLVLGAVSLFPSSGLAYRGDPSVQGPNYTPERHEAMLKAFESKDYDAWAKLMTGRGRVTQVVNKDNFSKFAEAHELAKQGKLDEAKKVRQELGLGLHNGLGQGRWANR